MTMLLGAIAFFSYAFGAFAMFSLAHDGTDIQIILAGVYFTCGTVALVGVGVVSRLGEPKPPPPPTGHVDPPLI